MSDEINLLGKLHVGYHAVLYVSTQWWTPFEDNYTKKPLTVDVYYVREKWNSYLGSWVYCWTPHLFGEGSQGREQAVRTTDPNVWIERPII